MKGTQKCKLLLSRITLFILFILSVNCVLAQSKVESKRKIDWPRFSRYAEKNASIDRKPIAVFMGNSITDNWANKVHPQFFKEHNFVGRGISGQTSYEMLIRFRPDVIELSPEIVVIMAGTNDIAMKQGYISLKHIMGNIASMCELAKYNHIKVILCSVLPASHFYWIEGIDPRNDIIELNKLIKEYAEKNDIVYVDYHSSMKDAANGLRQEFTKDGCHPIMSGYSIMENLILKGMEQVSDNF